MSFYNLRAAALTNCDLRSLNVEFERRARIEEEAQKKPEDEEDEAEDGEDNETLNIDDELIATMEDARNNRGRNVAEQSDLLLGKFPTDLIEDATKKMKISRGCSYCWKEGKIVDLCICAGCGGKPYHKTCWRKAALHKPHDGFKTCKSPTEFTEYIWIQHLLDSNISPEEQATLHRKDIWSTWFGVPHRQETPRLYIYRRLQLLISEAQALRDDGKELEQFPSLVSFFGDTGGGKSTIIRALIRNACLESSRLESAPVPGNTIDRHKSTSGDVHLYSDPATIDSEVPMFYADCEGLRGSGLSAAARITEGDFIFESSSNKQRARSPYKNKAADTGGYPRGTSVRQGRRGKRPSSRFNLETLEREVAAHKDTASRGLELQWAATTSDPSSSGRVEHKTVVAPNTRQIIVKDLYPRLLYTFSDVVCYVTNNPRATEAELLHLFEWASSGHERTLNQRVRPGLLIVVNKDVPSASEDWLDVDYATETLLSHLELSSAFADLRRTWRKRGKSLKTAEDLILCYYDSFRIICIPNLDQMTTHTIAIQYDKLYKEVRQAIEKMRVKKKSVGMNLNVQSFNKYMEYAFERLARDRTSLIDFHYLGSEDASRPQRFHEHMLALMISLKEEEERHSPYSVADQQALLKNLGPFLATCVAFRVRGENMSSEAQTSLVDRRLRDTRNALERFREKAWRCEAMNGRHRCVNYWQGHEKGHQFCLMRKHRQSPRLSDSSGEESLLVGDFQCTFDQEAIEIAMDQGIRRLLRKKNGLEAHLAKCAQDSGVTEISSYITCYVCLKRSPIFILPCQDIQHAFCQICLKRFHYETGRSESTLFLRACPLGCRFKDGTPWHIRVKSPLAGARLLSLDGGGIRGIIELCILKQVVAEVGFDIPIQELFDIAFGTSTGGIIALGLFKENWSIDKAIKEFERLSKVAFLKRIWLKVPVFCHTAQLFCSYRYKSDGIESALQKAFGQGPLFGHNKSSSPDTVKVGVVSGVFGERQPYIFTNYSRDMAASGTNYLVREGNPAHEIKTWEAARCTSAAPTYFEPYFHHQTKREYVDGALMRNNPVQVLEEERRKVWTDDSPLDIVLSIGTGIQANAEGATKVGGRAFNLVKNIVPKGLKGKVAVGLDMIQSTLDCEKQWKEFVSARDVKTRVSCHRINVGLDERPPNLDDFSKLRLLKQEAEEYLQAPGNTYIYDQYSSAHRHIGVVARRLLAALFYFEEDEESAEKGSISWTGRIHCRLSSSMTEQFGRVSRSGRPDFRLRQRGKTREIIVSSITTNFDLRTFSSPVKFEAETEEFVIEVKMYGWPGWERISGGELL